MKEGRTILLLVEDDEDMRFALALLLKVEGFEVLEAGDGIEAYRLALEKRPHLIITDINMPRVNGLELIGLARVDPRLSKIPIVAMSALETQDLDAALELGVAAAHAKPIDFELLLESVSGIVSNREGEPELVGAVKQDGGGP